MDSTVADVQVLFNTIPGTILYANPNQVNAIVQYGVGSKSGTAVRIVNTGISSNSITLPAGDTSPGLFTADNSGGGQVTGLNENGSYNSPDNPAAAGSTIVLFGTGAGLTTPASSRVHWRPFRCQSRYYR